MLPSTRILNLLDAIKNDFPHRKKAAEEELFRSLGIYDSIEQSLSTPEITDSLPTFSDAFHTLTPMLGARYEYCGTLKRGKDVWLSATECYRQMKEPVVLQYHWALRENWIGSAPNVFQDNQLTLFGVTEDVPDNLCYLVWRLTDTEPEVWIYSGLSSNKFGDLEQFFTWILERD